MISKIVSRLDDGKTRRRKRPKEEAEAAREAFSGKELSRGRTGRKLRYLAFAFASACTAVVVVKGNPMQILCYLDYNSCETIMKSYATQSNRIHTISTRPGPHFLQLCCVDFFVNIFLKLN